MQSDATLDFKKLEEFSRTLTNHLIEHGNKAQKEQMVQDLFDLVLENFGKDCIFHDRKYTAADVWSYLLSIINARKVRRTMFCLITCKSFTKNRIILVSG